MRILGALDKESYSLGIIQDLARLCSNTWSDVALVMVQKSGDSEESCKKALISCAKNFYKMAGEGEGPYTLPKQFHFQAGPNGTLELHTKGHKELTLRICVGDPAKAILKESNEIESDLIVIGCTKGVGCEWKGVLGLPQKIARDSKCSVLVVKETTTPRQIISFLDQTNVSQESLELINQMVTIHDAGLKIVGLMGEKGVVGKGDVERKMLEILQYYIEKNMHAWITFIEKNDVEKYVAQATSEGMVALWMGKQSFFAKIFSRDLLGKLIEYAQSSVLILR